jgi:hypothetical protein
MSPDGLLALSVGLRKSVEVQMSIDLLLKNSNAQGASWPLYTLKQPPFGAISADYNCHFQQKGTTTAAVRLYG